VDLKIENSTSYPLEEIQSLIKEFYPHAQKQLGFNKPVSVSFLSDPANSANPLGRTAQYDPSNHNIGLYVDKRHPKDILRSFSHELVHHKQNCQGKFDNVVATEGYAQQDGHLREMEKEAYLEGNMLLRDWEDSRKQQIKERKPMNEQKLRELTRKVIEELNTRGVAVTGRVEETMSDEEWMYGRFRGVPGYEQEATPGATSHAGEKAAAAQAASPRIARGGAREDHPDAAKYADQMDRLDRYEEAKESEGKVIEEEEVVEEAEEKTPEEEERERQWHHDNSGSPAYQEAVQKPTPIHESVAKKKGEVLFGRLMNKWCK